MIKRISISDFVKIQNPNIIDVREPHEYEQGYIPNAINIPVDEMISNCEKRLDINKKYYIYCETSLRSSRICEFLLDMGYDVYLIDGGYKEWLTFNKKTK